MILLKQLTMRYPGGKGIFDVSFNVEAGEVFGYLGPNGAGKTTTIRCLLGFLQPASGGCAISGINCWEEAPRIGRMLGYLPGEPAFFEGMRGGEFLRLLMRLRGIRDTTRQKMLLARFDLDPSGPIRRMSKGQRQKLAIVAAFMHDPAILILDEPSSGLDPLMQNIFIELIHEEKARGKTILMSSHSFEETDRTCDRAAIIRDGRLVAVESIEALKRSQQRRYVVQLRRAEDLQRLENAGFPLYAVQGRRAEIRLTGPVDPLLKALAQVEVEGLEMGPESLESAFMHYYGQEVHP